MHSNWTAFAGPKHIASGSPQHVAAAARSAIQAAPDRPVLVFDDASGRVMDIDYRGTEAEVVARLMPHIATTPPRGPGRPKLGVVAREVTLLPRHWEWLSGQPGGASVTLRRLVEAARKSDAMDLRLARERTYCAMTALAGDEAGYENATRALFAGDRAGFLTLVRHWPADIAAYISGLSSAAFDGA